MPNNVPYLCDVHNVIVSGWPLRISYITQQTGTKVTCYGDMWKQVLVWRQVLIGWVRRGSWTTQELI